MAWPVTLSDVQAYLGYEASDPADADAMTLAAKAATEWIAAAVTVADEPGPAVQLAGRMLAGRWYQRRTSPQGLASFQELGVSMIIRSDPDVARLLGLGKPAVR